PLPRGCQRRRLVAKQKANVRMNLLDAGHKKMTQLVISMGHFGGIAEQAASSTAPRLTPRYPRRRGHERRSPLRLVRSHRRICSRDHVMRRSRRRSYVADTNKINLVMSLLEGATSLDVMRDFLRRKRTFSSAPTWRTLTDQRILPAIEEESITEDDLVSLLRDV